MFFRNEKNGNFKFKWMFHDDDDDNDDNDERHFFLSSLPFSLSFSSLSIIMVDIYYWCVIVFRLFHFSFYFFLAKSLNLKLIYIPLTHTLTDTHTHTDDTALDIAPKSKCSLYLEFIFFVDSVQYKSTPEYCNQEKYFVCKPYLHICIFDPDTVFDWANGKSWIKFKIFIFINENGSDINWMFMAIFFGAIIISPNRMNYFVYSLLCIIHSSNMVMSVFIFKQ